MIVAISKNRRVQTLFRSSVFGPPVIVFAGEFSVEDSVFFASVDVDPPAFELSAPELHFSLPDDSLEFTPDDPDLETETCE